LSQHLAKLREEGLVATRKQAQTVFYRVADPRAERLLVLLQEIYCPELGGGTSRNFANG
jgi:DNA-binding transcriptional ArsR family regulator